MFRLLLGLVAISLFGCVQADPVHTVRSLQAKIASEYVTEDSTYWPTELFPPITWQEEKGIYKSYIHINFHGDFPLPTLRNLISIPDSNGFVTMFVDYFLLESYSLGNPASLNEDHLKTSIAAIVAHEDKNLPPASPIYNFWLQNKINGTWVAGPQNLAIPLEDGESFAILVKRFLEFLGLERFWKEISVIEHFPELFLAAFQIPSDSDDTGSGLALGLKLMPKFDSIYQTWKVQNKNIKLTIAHYKKFAYRPFSTDSNENAIDPRTYYWIRGFLDEQAAKKNTKLALVTTWYQNLEDVRKQAPGIRMPFNVNNVDASVVSNALFGITSTILEGGDLTWFDSDAQQIYSDCANLLEWVLRTDALNFRPDLVLAYYPPIYDFYWFAARLSFLLNNPPHALPFPVMSKVRDLLQKALETYGTSQLLERMKTCDGSGNCWDDFLGNDDGTPHYDDRLFSTAIALNAIFDTWTVSNEKAGRVLRSNTPADVVAVMHKGSMWLDKYILSDTYAPQNVFFSGSMKSASFSFPFAYPSNQHVWVNGTAAHCSYIPETSSINLVAAMSGYVTPTVYEKLLNKTCFGMQTPTNYTGMNCPDCTFPYWSSPALTYAAATAALSKFLSVLSGLP